MGLDVEIHRLTEKHRQRDIQAPSQAGSGCTGRMEASPRLLSLFSLPKELPLLGPSLVPQPGLTLVMTHERPHSCPGCWLGLLQPLLSTTSVFFSLEELQS